MTSAPTGPGTPKPTRSKRGERERAKSGNVKGLRFATLEAICDHLDCQPGDILEFEREGTEKSQVAEAG